jgi:D-glucosaminate-6-phosphate ammonia-lyase
MGVYDDLGVEPIINASGAVTRLGGAPMPAAVLDAFRQASEQWVPLEKLQAAASKVIAEATTTQAGLVTAGASAALTLGTAAILCGNDLAKMERLPDTTGFPHEIIVAREQRTGYDHAVRAAGARLVEVGLDEARAGAGVRRAETWEYEAAITENTVGILYAYSSDAHPPLKQLVARAHEHDLPVLVDAAGQLPPRDNLLLASASGADLVAFSGGKAIRGPQSTGILCGRRDLIGSAALQMLDMDEHFELWEPPVELIDRDQLPGLPRHGIGRAMKVSKEEIVAFLTAMSMFAGGRYNEQIETQRQCLEVIRATVTAASQYATASIKDDQSAPIMEIQLQQECPHSAVELCRRLRAGSPPIYVGHGKLGDGILVIDSLCLNLQDAERVGQRLHQELLC